MCTNKSPYHDGCVSFTYANASCEQQAKNDLGIASFRDSSGRTKRVQSSGDFSVLDNNEYANNEHEVDAHVAGRYVSGIDRNNTRKARSAACGKWSEFQQVLRGSSYMVQYKPKGE